MLPSWIASTVAAMVSRCAAAPEMPERSKSSSVMPTYQPRLTSPMTWSTGTRMSSKKVSLVACRQSIATMGRTLISGSCISITMKVMPRCFGASGSVRNMPNSQLDLWAEEVHIFWPLITYSSPSRMARVCSEARSEPAPGSE